MNPKDAEQVLGQVPTPDELRLTTIGINAVSLMSPLTGIGQYTHHLTRELHALGLSPWLFYGTGWEKEIRTQAMPGIGRAKNLFKRVVPKPYAVMRYLLAKRFRAGVRRHHIGLYHDPNFMAYDFRGPTVVTVHDLSWIRYPETHPKERVKTMNRLMPRTLERAAHVLVDSEFIRQEVIAQFGLPPEKVTTTLLGVTPQFRPMSEAECAPVLQSRGLRYGQYLLAVGTLEPRKNLSTVIASFAALPRETRRRFPLVIAGMKGWGENEQASLLHQLADRGEVLLAGYMPQQELPLLYAGARMLLYPSLYEGFGLPPLEAMASGVPVITSDRASLPEVVGDAGIMVEALDEAALIQSMLRLIEDGSLHARLAHAGIERARQFTWKRCALQTTDVYRKALAGI